MEGNIENAMRFYLLATKLKYKIRSGWDSTHWNVTSERVESVAEHVYGTLILAVGLSSEFKIDLDMEKVLKMLTIHETGEIIIGDLTDWDMPKEEKERLERQAVVRLLSSIPNGERLIKLLDEFNGHISLESEYAYLIDKIEYDMQVKMYEKEGKYDYNNLPSNVVTNSSDVRSIIDHGAQGVFDVHYEYDKDLYYRIPCFRRILEETKKY